MRSLVRFAHSGPKGFTFILCSAVLHATLPPRQTTSGAADERLHRWLLLALNAFRSPVYERFTRWVRFFVCGICRFICCFILIYLTLFMSRYLIQLSRPTLHCVFVCVCYQAPGAGLSRVAAVVFPVAHACSRLYARIPARVGVALHIHVFALDSTAGLAKLLHGMKQFFFEQPSKIKK